MYSKTPLTAALPSQWELLVLIYVYCYYYYYYPISTKATIRLINKRSAYLFFYWLIRTVHQDILLNMLLTCLKCLMVLSSPVVSSSEARGHSSLQAGHCIAVWFLVLRELNWNSTLKKLDKPSLELLITTCLTILHILCGQIAHNSQRKEC